MIIGVVQETNIEAIRTRVAQLPAGVYDVLELRLDACNPLDVAALEATNFPLPTLFTLRPQDQGGLYPHSEEQRWQDLLRLAHLRPVYMDLEYTLTAEQVAEVRRISPHTQIILSYHNFASTPQDLPAILARMQSVASDVTYKIATMAHSTVDALRMLAFCKQTKNTPVVGICMGPYGETTRILAPIVNTGFTYCPVAVATAPGQLDAKMLREVYNYPILNRHTAIYGLIGNPVAHSIGHVFHNQNFLQHDVNAVYVKWCLSPEELDQAIPLLQALDVKGLSVTTPLKEAVVPYASLKDKVVTLLGASNTLVCSGDIWHAYATDGDGTVAALGTSLHDKTVVILGAGGAARAIIHAIAKQADCTIVFNRTVAKAQGLGAEVYSLNDLNMLENIHYDIIINALAGDAHVTVPDECFHAGALAMDITYSKESAFLQQAEVAGCISIEGKRMFYGQAQLQALLWGIVSS